MPVLKTTQPRISSQLKCFCYFINAHILYHFILSTRITCLVLFYAECQPAESGFFVYKPPLPDDNPSTRIAVLPTLCLNILNCFSVSHESLHHTFRVHFFILTTNILIIYQIIVYYFVTFYDKLYNFSSKFLSMIFFQNWQITCSDRV